MTIETHAGSPTMRPDWSLGRYESTAAQLLPAAALTVDRAALVPGEAVLDLGCGSGNAALLAAATGARVTAVDPAPRLLKLARDRAAHEHREIAFLEGTAETLPLPDASIDAALSVFGVIFTLDPHRAAAELNRVVANPGRIVLTAWLPGGALSQLANTWRTAVFAALGQDPPPPFTWHDRETLTRLFGPHGYSIELEETTLVHHAPSLDDYLRDVVDAHPLTVAGRALLQPRGEAEDLRAQTRTILAEANEAPQRFAITSRYALITMRRTPGSPS
jgi:SAM-dependent methyltransferase